MDICKEAEVNTVGQVRGEDLEQINTLTRRALKAEEVYTFAVRLCDNEIDRDMERFDEDTLEELGKLFVGVSGVFDHQWSAHGQTARIYRTELVRESGVKTAAGDESCWLKAWAYLLRTEKNAELIAEIEGGIKKEVSVGCSMARRVCSICGAEDGGCQHVKGQEYNGKLCFVELKEPRDAYEWSFVAVPAQRNAGVVKRFGQEEQGRVELQRKAALGEKYMKELRREVVRLAMLADDRLDGAVLTGMAGKLEEKELLELKRVYDRQVEERFGMAPQLRELSAAGQSDETAFLV